MAFRSNDSTGLLHLHQNCYSFQTSFNFHLRFYLLPSRYLPMVFIKKICTFGWVNLLLLLLDLNFGKGSGSRLFQDQALLIWPGIQYTYFLCHPHWDPTFSSSHQFTLSVLNFRRPTRVFLFLFYPYQPHVQLQFY